MAMSRWVIDDPAIGVLSTLDPFATGFADSFRQLDRQMRHMQRDMDHMYAHAQQHFGEMSPMKFRIAEAENMLNPIVTEKDGSRKLQYKLDVRQFKPEEITLKTKDNHLEVHAKHEENAEHGRIYREYHRVCALPKELDPHTMTSRLGNDGVLCVEAPLPKALESGDGKNVNIPITHG